MDDIEWGTDEQDEDVPANPDHRKGVVTYVVMTTGKNGYGGAWGSGQSLKEARAESKNAGGDPSKQGMTVLIFDEETAFNGIDQMGSYWFSGNNPEVEEVEPLPRFRK